MPTAEDFKSKPGLKRVINATKYSLQGLHAAFKFEAAFRQEVFLFIVMTPFAFALGQTALEVLFLISTLFLVLIVEILNSALEALADRVCQDYDELIGRAKDMASAAIFLCFTVVVISWGYFVIKRFF